jgi:hypothetical protein
MVMGNDEHGPAYPDGPATVRVAARPYSCPICKGDQNHFMTCAYPDCPNGCDQPGRFISYPNEGPHPLSRRSPALSTLIVGWALAIALVVWAFWPHL